jgi:uncharacterized protein (TIGR02453 family)
MKSSPAKKSAIVTAETFRFFRDLNRNNRKDWMDANRERYQEHVVGALRGLQEALAPSVQKLNGGFIMFGGTAVNFSRINRDIRFAKDKTPYNPRMYVRFPDTKDAEGSQLYVGLTADGVTAGFRIYVGSQVKTAALTVMGCQRGIAHPAWVARHARRLGKKYECYWHASEKGEWTKHEGWPESAEDWRKVRAWIVRRKMKPAAATRPAFVSEVAKIFKDVAPLCAFASSPKWKP